jgi:hypothetical protein
MKTDLPERQLSSVVPRACEAMEAAESAFRYDGTRGNRSTLTVGASLRSWGERIYIEIEGSSIRITSQCSYLLQLFDWGKNRRNIKLVRRYILEEIQQAKIRRST